MAKNLTFNLKGNEYSFSPVKLDRSKVYGWTEIVAYDKDDQPCKTLYMDRTGSLLIPKGGLSYGVLDADNNWVDKADIQAVDMDGNPARKISLIPDRPGMSDFALPSSIPSIALFGTIRRTF